MQAASRELRAHESGPPVEAARFGVWLFLASEALLFSALIGSYLFLRTGKPDFPGHQGQLATGLVAGNTLALVASSFTLARAVHSNGSALRVRWLMATLLLGGAFLSIQLFEYGELLAAGILPRTNLFWSCFFVLTAVHGLHVFAGLVAIAWAGTRALRGNLLALELVGLYWHFVDVIWIVLFVLLYLV